MPNNARSKRNGPGALPDLFSSPGARLRQESLLASGTEAEKERDEQLPDINRPDGPIPRRRELRREATFELTRHAVLHLRQRLQLPKRHRQLQQNAPARTRGRRLRHERTRLQRSPKDDHNPPGNDAGASARRHLPPGRVRNPPRVLEKQTHGQPSRAAQQNARLERRYPIVRSELPRQGDAGVGEEFPNYPRLGSRIRGDAVRPRRRGRLHHGLPLSDVRTAGVCNRPEQLRQ